MDHIPNISFFDPRSQKLAAKLTDGKWVYDKMSFLEKNGIRKNFKTSTNLVSNLPDVSDLKKKEKTKIEIAKMRTLGDW